jgi:hypothetical protein
MSPNQEQEAVTGSDDSGDVTEPTGFFKRLEDFFKKPEKLTPLAAIAFLFGLFWLGPEVIEKSKTTKDAVRDFLASGFEPPPPQEIKSWIVFMAVALAGFLFVALLYAIATFLLTRSLRKNFDEARGREKALKIQLTAISSERDRLKGEFSQLENERNSLQKAIETERNRVQTTLDSRKNQLRRTLDGTVDAAARIRNQFFPPGVAGGGKTIEAVHLIYYIHKNFDAEVRRRYLIRAGKSPLHFWQSKISVSSDAAPIESLADIDYRLISHDVGKDVVYLPTLDESHSKAVCIFFLPRAEPEETRDIEAAYRWPGMFLQLRNQGWDKLTIRLNNPQALKNYQLEVYLEPGSGGSLSCSESGILLPNKHLESVQSHHGWPGWRYSGSDIPPELLENEIALKVDWTPA